MRKISVVILAQFDDSRLPDCIRYARKFSDEIVVASIGGKPAIDDIKVVELGKDALIANGFYWCRNQGLYAATGDWVVHVDTDETFCITLEDLNLELDRADAIGKIALRTPTFSNSQKGSNFDEVFALQGWEFGCHHWRMHKNRIGIGWLGIIHEELYRGVRHVNENAYDSGIAMLHLGPSLPPAAHGKSVANELLWRAQNVHTLRLGTDPYWFSLPTQEHHEQFWRDRGVTPVEPSPSPHMTHRNALIELLDTIDSPRVIELGCAVTDLLRHLSGEFESYETNREYADANGSVLVATFDHVGLAECDVLVVDHSPGERRNTDILRFADKAKFIVVHDTENAYYNFDRTLPFFKYKYTDMREFPWTTVVSNKCPIPLSNGLHEYVIVDPVITR